MSRPRAPIGPIAAAVLLGAIARIAEGAEPGGPAPIRDNSFLVEEAYNQERRVVQHISSWSRITPGDEYSFTFTQEWPVFSQSHQLSYTVPRQWLGGAGGGVEGWSDVAINYRYQPLGPLEGARLAVAPRLTLLLPTGDEERGLGAGALAGQFNLPLSLDLSSRLVTHTNAGFTYTGEAGGLGATIAYSLGQSLVWLAASRFNPLIEVAWSRTEPVGEGSGTGSEEGFLVSPGFRWAHDFPSGLQVVPGVACPIGLGAQSGASGVLLYLSLEHGF